VAVSVCLSEARVVPYRQRPCYPAKLAASRATSPTGLSHYYARLRFSLFSVQTVSCCDKTYRFCQQNRPNRNSGLFLHKNVLFQRWDDLS